MKMQAVKSTNLKAVGYEAGVLRVEFTNGTKYQYEASEAEFKELVKAESVGKHFNQNFRSRPATKVEDEE